MGRAPCCDKARVKRGLWSPEEDEQLRSHVRTHGIGNNWNALPQKAGLNRCGKSCRLRWLNYLRPDIRHGGYTEQEDRLIFSLYASIGSRWSIIASKLPGRTDNEVKNYWNTTLKKKAMRQYHGSDASLGAFSAPGTARSWSQSTSSLQPAALSSASSASSSVDTSSSGVICFAAAAMYQPPRPPQPMQGLVHFDSPPQTVLAPLPPAAAASSWESSASDSGVALEDTLLTDLDAYGDLLFSGFGGLMQDDEAATMELSAAWYFPNMSESADHANAKPPQGLCNTFT